MAQPTRDQLTDIGWLCDTCGHEGFAALRDYLRRGAEAYGGPTAAVADALLYPPHARGFLTAWHGVRATLGERLLTGSWRPAGSQARNDGSAAATPRALLTRLDRLRLHPPVDRAWVGHDGGIWSCDVSPDGERVLSASRDGTTAVWSMTEGILLARAIGGTGEARDCAFTADGRLAISVRGTEKVTILDGTTLEEVASFDVPLCQLPLGQHQRRRWRRFAVSPSGMRLAVAGEDTVDVWDLVSRRQLRTVRTGPPGCTFALYFWTDDLLAIVQAERPSRLLMFDMSSGSLTEVGALAELNPETAFVTRDREYLVGATSNALAVWTLGPPSLLRRVSHGIAGRALAISCDGRMAATSDDRGVLRLWSFPDLEERQRWDVRRELGGRDIACALSFTPVGDHLIVAGWEGILRRIVLGTESTRAFREGRAGTVGTGHQ